MWSSLSAQWLSFFSCEIGMLVTTVVLMLVMRVTKKMVMLIL